MRNRTVPTIPAVRDVENLPHDGRSYSGLGKCDTPQARNGVSKTRLLATKGFCSAQIMLIMLSCRQINDLIGKFFRDTPNPLEQDI